MFNRYWRNSPTGWAKPAWRPDSIWAKIRMVGFSGTTIIAPIFPFLSVADASGSYSQKTVPVPNGTIVVVPENR